MFKHFPTIWTREGSMNLSSIHREWLKFGSNLLTLLSNCEMVFSPNRRRLPLSLFPLFCFLSIFILYSLFIPFSNAPQKVPGTFAWKFSYQSLELFFCSFYHASSTPLFPSPLSLPSLRSFSLFSI